jgi:hypothetical protein
MHFVVKDRRPKNERRFLAAHAYAPLLAIGSADGWCEPLHDQPSPGSAAVREPKWPTVAACACWLQAPKPGASLMTSADYLVISGRYDGIISASGTL